MEHNPELRQNFLEQELEKHLANKPLDKELWSVQLQQLSFEKITKKQQACSFQQQFQTINLDNFIFHSFAHKIQIQQSADSFQRNLCQLQVFRQQLGQQQFRSDNLSFSKQNLSEQDLSNISLDKFFSENFGQQLSEQHLQNNLSTDQRQLQENKLQKNTFQQLSLEHPSFTEKILHKELATTFAKNSLVDNLVFQNFFFATLALQKVASDKLGENNLYKKQLAENNFTQTAEEACKEQLLTTGFPEASLNQQPFSNSLVQQSGAKAASRPQLLHNRASRRRACRPQLLPEQLGSTQLDD